MKHVDRFDLLYDESGHGPHIADKLKTCLTCRYCAKFYPELYEVNCHCVRHEAVLEGILGICEAWHERETD